MKKAKVMLAVLTVLAVAGGALAFKAKSFNQSVTIFKCTTSFFTDEEFRTGCFVQSIIPNAHLTVPDQGVLAPGLTQVSTVACTPGVDDVCTTKIVLEGAE